MFYLRNVILVALAIVSVHCEDNSWKNDVEYFERVDLDCAKFNFNQDVIHSVQAWILPSGDVWNPGDRLHGNHIVVRNNGFVLTIDRLEDNDFGVYYCIVEAGVNKTHVIKIGVNVDGPYFGPTFLEEIKHNAMVGGIAGGCTLVLLVILWLVCTNCTKTPLPSYIQKVPGTPEFTMTVESTAGNKMTKIGDSVYYNADEITVENEQTANEPSEEVKNRGTLSSTSSGDYHSIDSIDRNKKLQIVDPAEVYKNDVDAVHM